MSLLIVCLLGIIAGIFILYFIYQTANNATMEHRLDECIECDKIYNDDPFYEKVSVIKSVLSDEECDEIIRIGNQYASIYNWTTNRHENYPTTDNEILSDWECSKLLENKVKNIVFPEYGELYNVDISELSIEELFISKYDGTDSSKQNSLDFHKDEREFSFILALNDDYDGGGTHFQQSDKIIKIKKGDCLLFCGQQWHGGAAVTGGVRYVIAGFINYDKCAEMRD